MHIRIVVLVVMLQRFDDGARLLSCRRVIEIDQRMTANGLAQDREILANGIPIKGGGSDFVHSLICVVRAASPVIRFRGQKKSTAICLAQLQDQQLKQVVSIMACKNIP